MGKRIGGWMLGIALLAVAGASAASERLIIRFSDKASAPDRSLSAERRLQGALASAGADSLLRFKRQRRLATGAELFELQWLAPAQRERILERLRQSPGVRYAEFDARRQVRFVPSDPSYPNQWHYYEATGGIGLEPAWDLSTGSGAVVAVIDTGVRRHFDLSTNLLAGADLISDLFTANDGDGRDNDPLDPGDWEEVGECEATVFKPSSWHGTHVSGTVAARSGNFSGGVGVAFNSRVLPVRALGKCGGFTSDIADAILWSIGRPVEGVALNANPASVINMSLGGEGPCSQTEQAAIDAAVEAGVAVVVAAGNDDDFATSYSPGNCARVITVGATGRSGGRAAYSNFGPAVDLAAPGGDFAEGGQSGVLSTANSGQRQPGSDNFASYQGTSMATPHVAGVVALMQSLRPSLSPVEAQCVLEETARAFPRAIDEPIGVGIIDAFAALQRLGADTPLPTDCDQVTITPLRDGQVVRDLADSVGGARYFRIQVPAGFLALSVNLDVDTGDPDLYLRRGELPTRGTFDCQSIAGAGGDDACRIERPEAGDWFILVDAFEAYQNAVLSVRLERALVSFTSTAVTLREGRAVELGLSLSAPLGSDVVVRFVGSGTAVLGTDYSAQGRVIIPAGATSARLRLRGLADEQVEGDEIGILRPRSRTLMLDETSRLRVRVRD
ncbi:MAG TPA: S8 family serine peptidase [Nevskiaceae bacterium]|nr:S8 family serine peptidase [Nevskiaceae bacterium]